MNKLGYTLFALLLALAIDHLLGLKGAVGLGVGLVLGNLIEDDWRV